MDIYHHIPDEVVNTEPTPTSPRDKVNLPPACGQTYTVKIWHIPQTHHKTEKVHFQPPQTPAIAAQLKANAECRALTALYHVSASEWETSQSQWRTWVSSRATAGALDSGQFYTPPAKPVWQEQRGGGEGRFGTVLQAQHDECVSCAEVRALRLDGSLSKEEREQRVRRLAHDVPVLHVPAALGPVLPQRGRDVVWQDVVDVSAWGHKRAASGKTGSRDTVLGSTERGLGFDAQRVPVSSQLTARALQRLGADEKQAYSAAAAAALELQSDLMRLERLLESLGTRIRSAQSGYSVNRYNDKRCSDRRRNWADTGSHPIRYGSLGLHKDSAVGGLEERMGDMADEDENAVERREGHVAIEDPFADFDGSTQQHQQQENLTSTPVCEEVVQLKDAHEGLQSLARVENEQLVQSIAARNLFFNTRRSLHQHHSHMSVGNSKDNSAENCSLQHAAMQQGPSLPQDVTSLDNGPAATKGTTKKDSKAAEGLPEEDGLSVRDCAEEREEKRPSGPRKFSFKNGSPSKPRWRR